MERKKRNNKYKGSSSAPNSGVDFDVNLEYEFANVRQLAGKGIYSDHISNHPQRSSSVNLVVIELLSLVLKVYKNILIT